MNVCIIRNIFSEWISTAVRVLDWWDVHGTEGGRQLVPGRGHPETAGREQGPL